MGRLGRWFSVLAHLAVWPALYVMAAVVFLVQVGGLETGGGILRTADWLVLAAATGLGTYLLDRVKLRDAWLDPADAAAHPARYGFLARRTGLVRVVALVALVAATGAGAAMGTWRGWAAALPLASAGGVVAYAARPRAQRGSARPKDVLIFKNLYVAAGITGFAAAVALAAAHRGATPLELVRALGSPVVVFALVQLFGRVVVDAALCDLDDESADRRFGTVTLPTELGRERAWNVCACVRLVLAISLAAVPLGPARVRIAWAIATAATALMVRVARPAKLRDLVDGRFAVEAAVVSGVLALG